MDGRPRLRRLTVELPADLVAELADAAALSHRTAGQFVQDVLTREMARWAEAFPPPELAEDVQRALDDHPDAAAVFATVSRSDHRMILARIDQVKRPPTRAKRIAEAIAMLRATGSAAWLSSRPSCDPCPGAS